MMKNHRKIHTGDQNCSCISCLHKSGSDNQAVERYISHGSRIDRLYYGKYIPLRERKLIEKLVRTRAVYDDIRAKLISDSTISLNTKPDKKNKKKVLDDTEKGSGAVLEIVNLVDKGATLGLSECCSCCSCSSKGHVHVHTRRKHHRSHRGQYVEQDRLDTHRRKKGVRFKAKHIKSDPCTCTFKLSGLLKNKDFLKKNVAMELSESQPITNEERQPRHKRVREFARRSYENIKQTNKLIGEKVLEGVDKIKESKTNIQERLQVDAQSAAVNLKQRNRLKPKMKTEPPKKLGKNNLQLNELLAICSCPEDEIFETPRGSLLDNYKEKSKEKLIQAKNKLKSAMKSTIERRPKATKMKTKPSKKLNELLAICMCPEDQIFETPRGSLLDNYKEISKEKLIQAKNKFKSAKTSTIERRPKATKMKTERPKKLNELLAICMCPEDKIFETTKGSLRPKATKMKSKTSGTYISQENDLALQVRKDSIRKFKEELRRKQLMKDRECNAECMKDYCVPEECFIKLKRKRRHMKHAGHEHRIRNHEKKTGHVMNQKNVKIQNQASPVQAEDIHENQNLKRKQKDSPENQIKLRKGLRVQSSFSINYELYEKLPKTGTFAKASKESGIAKPTPSGINYKIPKKQKAYHHQRTSQMIIKSSSRDTQTERRSLKRCFCTLKLKSQKAKGKHKKKKQITTAEKSITTLGPSVAPCKQTDCSVEMCDKMVCEKLGRRSSNAHTNTGNKLKKKRDIKSRHLLPYECEPGVCTPGDCDPYECIKLINMRKAKLKTQILNCDCPSRKTKSTSTLTSRSHKASNAKIAQSLYTYSTPPKRNEGVVQKRNERIVQKRNEGIVQKRNEGIERQYVHNTYGRQAVRIGSTFSFNIEFYKNKPSQDYSQPSDLKIVSVKPKLKDRGYQGDVASFHKNIPTQMYKKPRDAAVSTTLKRCFCTLKLQRKSQAKIKRKKMFSTGTKTIEEPFMSIETSTKATKTKQKYLKSLKPYECEPFTCIPGECNPYECLERIRRRNLRDIGVSSTFNRSEINKGSSTSEKSLKAVNTQSKPRTREQKVLTKVKKHKKQTQKYKDYSSSARPKQAVKVGSTFSFNIEFYKNQLPKKQLKTNYQMRPAVKLDTKPITKNRGVKIVKLNVANLDTQVEESKKRNKTSSTKPLLKRCFCTLNLQKRKSNAFWKSSVIQSNVYTVNRAMVDQNRLSFFRTHCTKNICLSRSANINMNTSLNCQLSDCIVKSLYNECKRLNSIKHLQRESCCPIITNTDKLGTITSNFNTALKLISQSNINDNLKLSVMGNSQLVEGSNNGKVCSSHINQEKKSLVRSSNNFNGGRNHLTGLTQYLKGYFCTMNLKVVRNKNIGKQKYINAGIGNEATNNPRKLKPYECEPGVCVPGECDPYECLKLINKRGSNFSKKTGTESTATTSSYTSRTPKYKSYKIQSLPQKTKPQVSRAYIDQNKQGQKSACRVGSSFSFNIEFSKKLESPHIVEKVIEKPVTMKKKPHLTKPTRMKKPGIRNRYSQSPFSRTLQKASATLPRMKRCFCTLKLQKKGRLRKEEASEGLQTEAILPELTTINRGQNAPKFKPLKFEQSLQPYECPPGICIPGQCNPYECLEIMKKLNANQTADFGTDAIRGESKSSSAASDQKYRTRKINAKPRVVSKSNLSEVRQKRRVVEPTQFIKPERQAVRIGSSFSFNIEFHKSQPSLSNPRDYIPKMPSRRVHHKVPELKKRHKKIKHMSSETHKPIRHQQLQIENTVQAASTMTTSFMKRCFCVLKLKKNKNKKIDDRNVVKVIHKPQNMDKKTNTKHYKERILQLEPYECEPGICIPGECDPYVCEKLIKRRNNQRSISSSTDYSTRSASSSPRTGTKNINTQFRPKRTTRETIKQVNTKTKIRNSNRQAVRIGSNFSFNIEFYKNKTSKFKDYEIPEIKTKDRLHFDQKKKKQKNSGTISQLPSYRSQMSQMQVNKRDFAAGINNVIKRCFCTLQLYNQRSRKQNKDKVVKNKPIKNEVHSKGIMTTEKNKIKLDSLLPYECEPNICVPYECDPYECEKLIKLRQRKKHQREIGMSTQHLSKQSIASSTAPFKKYKKRTQSISFKNKEKVRKVKSLKRTQEAQSKQCVKIGSTFSFNIEFSKNKTPGLQLDQKPQYIKPKYTESKHDRTNRRIKTRSQALQSQKSLHASSSQMENEYMKTQATMARFTPPLKRCFCTFYLKNPKKEVVSIPKPLNVNAFTETKFRGVKLQPVPKLLPYECEPNICIPGECNPLECLERIKTRLKQQKNYGTSTEHLRQHETGSSMGMNRTRNKRLQFKPLVHVKQRQHRQPIIEKPSRQAVRIGSNFSFNIDFYKESGSGNFDRRISHEHRPKHISKPLPTKYIDNRGLKIDKQVNKNLDHILQRHRGNQSPHIKQSDKFSAIDPFLKRCFCTLKLKKKPATKDSRTKMVGDKNNIPKVSPPKIVSMDRGTLTKKYKNKIDLGAYECEPYTCIPGECDPYECLKRIEARNLKYRNISTQMLKQCQSQCVGINLGKLYSKKIQSNLLSTKTKFTEKSNIVEVPRFGNLFNKQAVKIGSNFSFNIEFYKEFLPPTPDTDSKCDKIKCYEDTRPKKPKRYSDASMTSQIANHHDIGIQGNRVKTDSKALEVGNALKRCFCTLKLQKELNSKQGKPKYPIPQYPQVIEVRRVSVQNKRGKKNKNTLTEVKSIGTKTQAKYLNNNIATCNPTTCKNFRTLKSQEMKVILPYAPNKFNKTPSKTIQNNELFNNPKTKPRKTKITNRGKRLTKKKSLTPLNRNHLGENSSPSKHSLSNLKKFMCKCKQIFSHKTQGDNALNSIDKPKQRKEVMNGIKNKTHYDDSEQKRIKSLKLNHKHNKKCNENCPYRHGDSHYQAGDISQSPTMSLKMVKKHEKDKTLDAAAHKNHSMVKKSEHQQDNKKTKQIPENILDEKEDFFCSHCKNIKMNKRHSQPLKVHFRDTPIIKNEDVGKKTKAKDGLPLGNKSVDQIDKNRKSIQSRKLAKYCKYCTSCGSKLINEEIHKAAGDQKSIKSLAKEKTTDLNQSTSDKIKNLFKFKQSVDNICSAKAPDKPLFEMHLDSDDYGILNKDEVADKVQRFQKKRMKVKEKPHDKSCRCCICLAKNRTGAYFNVKPKHKGRSVISKKPCICGSPVCAKKLAKMGEFHVHRRQHFKPCDCGSPVCDAESKIMRALADNQKLTCICAQVNAKRERKLKKKRDYLENKQRAIRLKNFDKDDKIRKKLRHKLNKQMEKKLDKSSSDTILLAESLIDIGKLGITACTDILRLVARTAIDPKHAYNNLKAMKDDPTLIARHIKAGIGNSGMSSTCRRIRLRCLAMTGVKNIRTFLESYPLTNYLLYIAHKDPKRRLPKKRPRQREQLDFNCSLYMGSLRKKPYLYMYNKYPWFYPHFLSLLNVWKQFTDIALFLLAVLVWSPCIFCMEACRACMCCFFCTG